MCHGSSWTPKEVEMSTLTEVKRWEGFRLEGLNDVAHDLGQTLPLHGVVAIHGAMGAGKTTMVRRLLEVWKVEEEGASPTLSLIHI